MVEPPCLPLPDSVLIRPRAVPLRSTPAVRVEGLVLRRHEGVLDGLGNLGEVDDLAVGVAFAGHRRAVVVLVDVALLLRVRVALGHGDHHVHHDEGADAEQTEGEERAKDLLPGEEPSYRALAVLGVLCVLLALGGLAGRCPAAGHDALARRPGRACGRRRAATTALTCFSLFRSSHGSTRSASSSAATPVRGSGQLRKLTPLYMTKDIPSGPHGA